MHHYRASAGEVRVAMQKLSSLQAGTLGELLTVAKLNPIVPREWFLVSRFVVDDAVEKIKDNTITGYTYDPATAQLVLRS